MKRKLIFIVFFLATLAADSAAGESKSKYDLPDLTLAKSGGIPFLGWKIKKNISELTVLPGYFFTWGTVDGKSSTTLDNNTSLLFGHPYAKTSYTVVDIDGEWKRPENFFPNDSTKVILSGDSSITVINSGHPLFTLVTTYLLLQNGAGFQCTMRLINKHAFSHSLSLGFIIDPAIGNRGDAVVSVGGQLIGTDTSLAAAPVTLSERNGETFGIRAGLSFDSVPPSTMVIKNWSGADAESPSFMPGKIRRLYDVVLRSFWPALNIAAHDTLTRSFILTLTQPAFGSSVFTRWDVPRFLGLEDGIMHPSSFTSTASIVNNSDAAKTVSLRLTNNNYIDAAIGQNDTTVSAHQIGYVHFPIAIKEIYEDVVADLQLVTTVNSVGVDTLTLPLYIPATPVSDTGLTVDIDSLIVSAKPKISTIFEVTRNATGQKIFALKNENIFLYENDTRIRNFTLQKDTTGGADALDLIFVLDVTGSMGGTINGVKDNIIEFTDSLKERGVDFRIGMVTFLDIIENEYPFTTDAQAFKNIVAQQYAHGGDDAPENSLDALYRASLYPFRNNAKRVVIWITDITYHESDNITARTKTQVVNALLQNDITVHAIGPEPYQTDWYNPIIQPTGGNFYNIYGNFRDILLDISRLKTTSRFLLSYNSPAAASGLRTIKLEIHFAGLGGSATTSYQGLMSEGVIEQLTCFPNPFNPQTTINLQLPSEGSARITIYNILGKKTRQFELHGNKGTASLVWDATDNNGNPVASGMYLIRAEVVSGTGAVTNSGTLKLIYLK